MPIDKEVVEVLLSPWVLGLFGLCVGSFLNVVIHRLPLMLERGWKMESADMLGVKVEVSEPIGLAKPRSRCPSCGHLIAWHENIPVLSWLLLKGRCAQCKTPISKRYPFVELLTAVLFAAVASHFGPKPIAILWCLVVAALIALGGIDWDTTLLPDNITLPLLWAGLISSAMGWTIPLGTAVWGAVAGYLSLWTVYWFFKLTTGKEGMGFGDFKLLAALGAWLGWSMLLPIVLGASVIGAIVGIGMKLNSSLHDGRYVPFGPFLVGGGITVMLAGPARVFGWLGWAY